MKPGRLYQLDKFGNLSIANPHNRKIESLKAQGKILTYDELTLPQRQLAKELEEATDRFLARIDETLHFAKKLRSVTTKEPAPPRRFIQIDSKVIEICRVPDPVFGERLKALREEFGFTQQQVGELAGLKSPSTIINDYESGKRLPSISTIKQIAAVFSVPMAYFLAEHDELAGLIRAFKPSNSRKI